MSELDGLRGVAALSVYVAHASGAIATIGAVGLGWRGFVFWWGWLGPAAVALFFVLSGFVLALPFGGARPRPFSQVDFLVRRFFRIYPGFWAALLLAVALRTWAYQPEQSVAMGPWLGAFWQAPARWGEFWNHVSIVRITDSDMFNTVVWTLEVEVQMSVLLMVYIAALCYRRSLLVVGAVLLASFLAAYAPGQAQVLVSLGGHQLVGFGFGFAPLFVMGASLAFYWQEALPRIRRLPRAVLIAGLGLGVVCYTAPGWLAAEPVHVLLPSHLVGVGTLILLVAAGEWRGLARPLRSPPVQFLGRVSYGLYLTHFPFLLVCLSWTGLLAPSVPLACLEALGLSLVAAYLLYRWVETPGRELGRRLLAHSHRPVRLVRSV